MKFKDLKYVWQEILFVLIIVGWGIVYNLK